MVEKEREKLSALKQQTIQSQEVYKTFLLSHLGIEVNNPFAGIAEEILGFCESNQINPQWFFSEITKVAQDVNGNSPDIFWGYHDKLPKAKALDQFYNCAIHNIRCQGSISVTKHNDDYVTESLQRAAIKSTEQENKNSQMRMSVVYQWLNQNRNLLYEVHSKYYRQHFREDGTLKPNVVVPKELTQLLDNEVNSVEKRVAEVAMEFGSNTERGMLLDILNKFGYKVEPKHRYRSEPGEPYYPEIPVTVSGWHFTSFADARGYVENLMHSFEQRLQVVLTSTQKSQMDVYWNYLSPIMTPLAIGAHGLEYPRFVDNKFVYLRNVDVGFNIPEAAQLIEFGLNHGLSTQRDRDYMSVLDTFLLVVDLIRKELVYQWSNGPTEPIRPYRRRFDTHGYTKQKVGMNSLPYLESIEILFEDFAHGMGLSSLDHVKRLIKSIPNEQTTNFDTVIQTVFAFLTSDTVKVLERPTRLKYLYEEKSYKIFGLDWSEKLGKK